MDTIFTVRNDDLERLSPVEAVNLFRELLWAEARKISIPISKIHISTWVDVPDGGIDAAVENPLLTPSDLIKEGRTGYQIKAGASFKPWQDAQIKKELFGKKHPGKENLGTSIRDCLDNDGTYVLVCFKQEFSDEQRRQASGSIEYYFKQCGYPYPKIEVWGQSNLLGFIKMFPSLALNLTGKGGLKFQAHHSWSQDAEMRRPFVIGQAWKDRLASIQEELRRSDEEAIHIRIFGDPGIGKTRLVLEATREKDLQPLVVYSSAAGFRDSGFMNEMLKDDNPFSVILVLDECDKDTRAYIWDKLKFRGARIKLISIYNESDETIGNIRYFETPPLEDEQISNIIQAYGVPKERADKWAELCSGSPRVAHVIGLNLINNQEDLLKAPDTVNIWDRYIVGGDDPNGQQVEQRRTVLRHLALFKRFGVGASIIKEAQAIAQFITKTDPQITWGRFQEIIRNLKGRKILQGENTLYITPKALHIYLWIEWWDTYGTGFNLDDFSKDLPAPLKKWFYEMFKYAAESEAASRVVQSLLGEGGPFQHDAYLKTKLGANFFLALAEADPEIALERLKRTVGTWNKDRLLEFTTGRREVIWALEKIVMHRRLFPDAARLLLALGEAENETVSNNASGVFASIFSPAPGRVATTEASPEERFPILKETLESPSKERRLLALNACNAALRSGHFMRMIGDEYQGLKELKLWTPKTWGEIFSSYRRVWKLLEDKLDLMEDDEQQKAIQILLEHTRGLGAIANLFDMVIDTVASLSRKAYVKREDLITTIVQVLHYEHKRLPKKKLQRWEKLRDDIIGTDYSSLLRRYVGMDLLEDHFNEKGDYVDQTRPRIEELAQQSAENIELAKSNMSWLVITETQNCARFGYELGKRDEGFSLLPLLLESQKKSGKTNNITFLGGYFRALFEKDQKEWEKQFNLLMSDQELRKLVAELTWRSGLTDKSVLRMLEVIKRGISDKSHFQMLRGNFGELSIRTITAIAEFLLDSNDTYSISILLQLYDSYYLRGESKPSLPEQITFRMLIHPSLLGKNEPYRRNTMDDFNWSLIAKKFIADYPARSLELAENMLEHFEEEGSIVSTFSNHVMEVLDSIVSNYPLEIWGSIEKYIGPPLDTRAWHITRWLRGSDLFENTEGSLRMIPLDKIWEWVETDIEKRARYLASFVPNRLFREEGKVCLAREALRRYGNREDVRHSFAANYGTEGWSGPASLHYETKKQQLLDFKKDEDDANVKLWIDEYVASLDQQIEREKIDEERED